MVSSWRESYDITLQAIITWLDDYSEGKHVSRFDVPVARGIVTCTQHTAKIHSMEIQSLFIKLNVVHESDEDGTTQP